MSFVDNFLDQKLPRDDREVVGIGGFKALCIVNEQVELSSQMPTTYLEDGSSAEDHIVLESPKLTIEGVVSDVYREPTPAQLLNRRVQQEIGNINAFLPARTQTQIQKANAAVADVTDQLRRAERAVRSGRQVLDIFSNESGNKSLQEQFISALEALHYGKQLISIDTQFRRFDNMRIVSFERRRDNQRKQINFVITAQQFRFVETIFTDAGDIFGDPSQGLDGQGDGLTDKGQQTGVNTNPSLLSFGVSLFGGG